MECPHFCLLLPPRHLGLSDPRPKDLRPKDLRPDDLRPRDPRPEGGRSPRGQEAGVQEARVQAARTQEAGVQDAATQQVIAYIRIPQTIGIKIVKQKIQHEKADAQDLGCWEC